MMVGPVRLLIHLWWCTHIDSWHVVSWFAYISDLESCSTFVWSMILMLLCRHSLGDVWSCFSIRSLRLCISFSLHHRWAYPWVFLYGDIMCLMLVTILHWGIPLSLSSSDVLQVFLNAWSISWSLRVVISGHTPFSAFLLGHSPLFEFSTFHADFMVVRPICRSLRVVT